MTITEEIEKEIYRYTMRTGDAPDLVLLNLKKFGDLREELGLKHSPGVPVPDIHGIPVVPDAWAVGVHAYSHRHYYRPHSQELQYGSCECGSKNAVGRGHSVWCPFYRPA